MRALLFHLASLRVRRVRRKNSFKSASESARLVVLDIASQPLGLQLSLINLSACTSTISIVVTHFEFPNTKLGQLYSMFGDWGFLVAHA